MNEPTVMKFMKFDIEKIEMIFLLSIKMLLKFIFILYTIMDPSLSKNCQRGEAYNFIKDKKLKIW